MNVVKQRKRKETKHKKTQDIKVKKKRDKNILLHKTYLTLFVILLSFNKKRYIFFINIFLFNKTE